MLFISICVYLYLLIKEMVGVAGFKPTTSPTPRVRANQAALYSAKRSKGSIISNFVNLSSPLILGIQIALKSCKICKIV